MYNFFPTQRRYLSVYPVVIAFGGKPAGSKFPENCYLRQSWRADKCAIKSPLCVPNYLRSEGVKLSVQRYAAISIVQS